MFGVACSRHTAYQIISLERLGSLLARPDTLPFSHSAIIDAAIVRQARNHNVSEHPFAFSDPERAAAETFIKRAATEAPEQLALALVQPLLWWQAARSSRDEAVSLFRQAANPRHVQTVARAAIAEITEHPRVTADPRAVRALLSVAKQNPENSAADRGIIEDATRALVWIAARASAASHQDLRPKVLATLGNAIVQGEGNDGRPVAGEHFIAQLAREVGKAEQSAPNTLELILREIASRHGFRCRETLNETTFIQAIARLTPLALEQSPTWRSLPERSLGQILSRWALPGRSIVADD